jgi:glycosyltransferase involved in cell wall biosynthesis
MPSCRLSVALCTYNGSAYLPEQLESLSRQTRKPDELVVFDDASSDQSADLIRAFAESAPFPVSLHINPKNVGPSENFRLAIEACGGDVIALCDQDDIWMPKKLEAIDAEFRQSPNLGLVFSDAEICDQNAGALGYNLWKSVGFTPTLQHRLSNGRAFQVILRQNIVTGATMAFSARFKSLVLPVGPHWVHDGWIALLISAVAPVRIIPEPLIRYRQHPSQCVGALWRTLYQQYQNAKKMDRQVFAQHAQMYQAARERLLDLNGQFPCASDVLAMLDAKVRHYQTRSAIRLGERGRLLSSVTEMLTFRYRRYSMGWKSFAQDLFL